MFLSEAVATVLRDCYEVTSTLKPQSINLRNARRVNPCNRSREERTKPTNLLANPLRCCTSWSTCVLRLFYSQICAPVSDPIHNPVILFTKCPINLAWFENYATN